MDYQLKQNSKAKPRLMGYGFDDGDDDEMVYWMISVILKKYFYFDKYLNDEK